VGQQARSGGRQQRGTSCCRMSSTVFGCPLPSICSALRPSARCNERQHEHLRSPPTRNAKRKNLNSLRRVLQEGCTLLQLAALSLIKGHILQHATRSKRVYEYLPSGPSQVGVDGNIHTNWLRGVRSHTHTPTRSAAGNLLHFSTN